MDKYTVHYSGINKTAVQRRALIFRYGWETNPDEQLQQYFEAERIRKRITIESYLQIMRAIRQRLEVLDIDPKTYMLSDFYKESKEVWRIIRSILSKQCSGLCGGISPELRRGEQTSIIEKRHLILNRVFHDRAMQRGVEYFDMGTDYFYPFYSSYEPTQNALEALKDHTEAATHYPSSYGLLSLRQAFQDFMFEQFSVELDRNKEIMINTGASQAFDALSRTFNGHYVLLPSLSLPTVSVVAQGNGVEVIRLPLNQQNGLIDLHGAQQEVDQLKNRSILFMYLNSPVNPTGHVASLDYLKQVVQFAKRNHILILHDMDSWFTCHTKESRIHNILEVEEARDYCITILSLSKEFGLPGIRIGLIAGNSDIINSIRVHNSIFAVMIPEVCQHAAEAALRTFGKGDSKEEINNYLTNLMHKTIKGWKQLGWPEDAIYPPRGGFKYLISVPPNISPQGNFSAVELFDYYVTSRAYVKLSTSRSFNPSDDRFIRIILMQNETQIDQVFSRFKSFGISFQMDLPPGLGEEYAAFIKEYDSNDF